MPKATVAQGGGPATSLDGPPIAETNWTAGPGNESPGRIEVLAKVTSRWGG